MTVVFTLFQVFRVQVNPRFVDVQNLNQYASELRNISPVTAESLTPQVQDINERWGTLLSASQDREVSNTDRCCYLSLTVFTS